MKPDLRPNGLSGINPVGTGYQGELGTLRSFANEFDSAEKAFHDALAQQPDDYVSLTGLGILQLKRGDPNAALESFLKSGVIEPRYARGALYTGVAYYQLGNYPRAMEMFGRAAELDPRDPMPHMMMSMAATDRLDFGAAIAAARRASDLMPYLKSLNQLLNDQKGNANIGTSLARFGMEDWSQAYAHNSYTPYWAGSHLFLADRYSGEFNKNSELFLGFLTDPTVFGASNRFNTMVASPGQYAHVGMALKREDTRGLGMNLAANGYSASPVPFSYFVSAEPVQVRPDYTDMRGNGNTYTVGLGARPSYEFSTFLFANNFSVDAKNTVTGDNPLDVTLNDNISRVDLGASYKFSPTSLLWVKAGSGRDAAGAGGNLFLPDMANYFNKYMDIIFDVLGQPALCAPLGGCYSPKVGISRYVSTADQNDIQLRHTFDFTKDWQISWGGESGRQQKPFAIAIDASPVPMLEGSRLPPGNLLMLGDDDVRTAEVYVSGNTRLNDNWRFQADLSHIRLSKRQWSDISISADPFPLFQMPRQRDDQDFSEWNPRLGFAWNPAPNHTLRVVAQVWRRPASVNTLATVDTVGIPVDDRMVSLGGHLQRIRAQYELEMNTGIFVQGFLDSKRVSNLTNAAGNFIGDFGLSDLKRLRNVTQHSLAAQDIWEATPEFGSAVVDSAGIAINRVFSDTLSGSLRYNNNHSRNTGAGFQGNQVPWLSRHILNLGANWIPSARWQLGLVSTYRSSRYKDEANTQPLAAGWNFGLQSRWESVDKSWAFEMLVNNLHPNKSSASRHSASLTAQMLYRF
ncbi:MAG: TonB-dependent receptor [Gallionella sp.]|nr:TonB-dependent receptor [Gallionella sp.]